MMLGINSDMTAVLSLAIGSALAGLAAVLLLPLGNIVVEGGYNVLVFAVAVCVIGGLGSWGGVIVASFIIGFAQIMTEFFITAHPDGVAFRHHYHTSSSLRDIRNKKNWKSL